MRTISMEEAQRLVREGGVLPQEERLKLQRERLTELVDHVKRNSSYFARLYAGLSSDTPLTELPITQKPTLLANYDDWVTDRRLHLPDVLAYVNRDPLKDQSLLLGQYTAVRTSGSTGNPLPLVRDDYHNKIHGQLIAQRLFCSVGLDVVNIANHRRASIIHMSNGASSYGAYLRMKAAHPESAHNLLGISVLDSVDSIVARLNDFQPETMAGYPSMLAQLAVEQLKGHLRLNLIHLTTSGEMLTPENYQLLRKAFQCPVANNYCMSEGGEVAMTHDCPHLHINDDWVIVEPVDSEFRPLGMSDQWSAGLLVTDLANYVQPVIRYFVSDVVRISPSTDECSQLPILSIRGRAFDMYTVGGKTFSVAGLVTEAEVWPNLVRYQFVQTDADTIEVRGVCSTDAETVLPQLCEHLSHFLADQGCPSARFTWSTEHLIPNKRGGKIPVYVKL